VLAFDATCGRCRQLSSVVEDSAGDRVEILPLAHDNVAAWRKKVFGPEPPSAPTLIKVDGDRISAWTGPAMGVRLATRLGPRATVRLLSTLGELGTAARSDERRLGRRRLLKLGTGMGIAVGVVLAGTAPAFAESTEIKTAKAWAKANRIPVAELYDQLGAYSSEARRAAQSEFTPAVRSSLWSEHLRRYRRDHPELSARQVAVLDKADALATDEAVFAGDPTARERVRQLDREAAAAFGCEEYRKALVDLGPPENPALRDKYAGALPCNCHKGSACEFCANFNCYYTGDNCGCLGIWACNGFCI